MKARRLKRFGLDEEKTVSSDGDVANELKVVHGFDYF